MPLPTQRRLAGADPTPRRQASAGAIPAPSCAHVPDPTTRSCAAASLRPCLSAPASSELPSVLLPTSRRRTAANPKTPWHRRPRDAVAPPSPRRRAEIPEMPWRHRWQDAGSPSTARRRAAADRETPGASDHETPGRRQPQYAGPRPPPCRCTPRSVRQRHRGRKQRRGVSAPQRPRAPIPPSLCPPPCGTASPRRRVPTPPRPRPPIALTSPTPRPPVPVLAPPLPCARIPLRPCYPAPASPELLSSAAVVSRDDRGRPPRRTSPQRSSSAAIVPRGILPPRQSSSAAIAVLPRGGRPRDGRGRPHYGRPPLRSSPAAVVGVPRPPRRTSPWWSWSSLRRSFATAFVSAMIAVVPRCGRPPRRPCPRRTSQRRSSSSLPGPVRRAPHQRSVHVLPARDGLPQDRQDSPIMLGAAEEPKLRAEGVHDGEKISAICHFFYHGFMFYVVF